jgi:hypothetical protein
MVSLEGKLGLLELTAPRANAASSRRVESRSTAMSDFNARGAFCPKRFQPVQVQAVAPELRGLQPDWVPEWRYNAFELLF